MHLLLQVGLRQGCVPTCRAGSARHHEVRLESLVGLISRRLAHGRRLSQVAVVWRLRLLVGFQGEGGLVGCSRVVHDLVLLMLRVLGVSVV